MPEVGVKGLLKIGLSELGIGLTDEQAGAFMLYLAELKKGTGSTASPRSKRITIS